MGAMEGRSILCATTVVLVALVALPARATNCMISKDTMSFREEYDMRHSACTFYVDLLT